MDKFSIFCLRMLTTVYNSAQIRMCVVSNTVKIRSNVRRMHGGNLIFVFRTLWGVNVVSNGGAYCRPLSNRIGTLAKIFNCRWFSRQYISIRWKLCLECWDIDEIQSAEAHYIHYTAFFGGFLWFIHSSTVHTNTQTTLQDLMHRLNELDASVIS